MTHKDILRKLEKLTDRDAGEVIGVIRDFNFASPHNKIEPLIIFPVGEGWGIEYIYVKVNPIRPSNLISQIEGSIKKHIHPFLWNGNIWIRSLESL